MMKYNFFSGLFLSYHVLKSTFASIFVNSQAVLFSLHAWFGLYSFLAHYWVIHNYGNSKFPLPSLNRERYRVL